MSSLFSDPAGFLLNALMVLPGIVIGLSFHEFAHAWMADKLGDPTPRSQGRVTISPFAHIDPMGFLMLFLFRFGYGRPVQVNPSYYKHRRRDDILVSLAGVTMNFLLAIFFGAAYLVMIRHLNVTNEILLDIVYYIMVININLMVFNLLPIPPLDGYHVVRDLFLHKNINFFWKFEQYGWLILIVVLVSGFSVTWLNFLGNHVLRFISWILQWI